MTDHTVTITCASCGQHLVVPTSDLRAVYRCPRCGAAASADALVDRQTPLRAVTVADPGTGNVPVVPITPLQFQVSPQALLPATTAGMNSRPGVPVVVQAGEGDVAAGPVAVGQPSAEVAARAALGHAARGVARAADGVAWTADVLSRFDARLHRRRGHVLLGGAGTVYVAAWVSPWVYAAALVLFALICWGLLMARVWALRDDEGRWTWTYARSRFAAGWRDVWASAVDLVAAAAPERARRIGTLLVTLGAIAAVIAPPTELLVGTIVKAVGLRSTVPDVVASVGAGGGVLVAIGILCWLYYRSRLRRPEARAMAASLGRAARDPCAVGLGPVLDIWKLDDAALGRDPALAPLLAALRSWRPRSCEYEADYENSLVRHLKKHLPVAIETQVPLFDAHDRLVGRMDVVVAEHLVIELKRAVGSSQADRAVGQIWKYVDHWTSGPILLLLCETRASFAEELMFRRLTALRDQGKPIWVVAAGRRLSEAA